MSLRLIGTLTCGGCAKSAPINTDMTAYQAVSSHLPPGWIVCGHQALCPACAVAVPVAAVVQPPEMVMLQALHTETFRKGLEQKNGTDCPLCFQRVKLYERAIYGTTARALIAVYHYFNAHPQEEWVHLPTLLENVDPSRARIMHEDDEDVDSAGRKMPRGGDEAKLVHWGLLEPKRGTRTDGSKRDGMYRITELGRQYIHGRQAYKYVYLYNQTVYGFSDGTKYRYAVATIQDALRKNFNYGELMNPVVTPVFRSKGSVQ